MRSMILLRLRFWVSISWFIIVIYVGICRAVSPLVLLVVPHVLCLSGR